jgi:hypothetical protein
MKTSLQKIVALSFIAFFISPLLMTAEDKDWREWSLKDTQNVVFKATRGPERSMGERFGAGIGGATTGVVKMTLIEITWLTDPVIRALVRATQINERLTDEEAIELYEKLRSDYRNYYGFCVSAPSLLAFRNGPILQSEDDVEIANPNRIFLQYPNDNT